MIGWHSRIHHRHVPPRVDGIGILFTSAVLRRVGITFLVFSPLYILEVAERTGLSQSSGLGLALSFFALLFLSKLLFLPLAEALGDRFGFRTTLIFSGIPTLLFIPSLVLSRSSLQLLFLSAVFWGAHTSLFWWGYHGFFIKTGKPQAFGKEMGVAKMLDTLAMISSPILGALIVSFFGFAALFWAAGLMLVLAIGLLVPAAEHRPERTTSLREVVSLVSSHKPIALAYIGNAAEVSAQSSIWPLFLFLTLGSVVGVGGVFSAAVLIAAVLTFLIGAWVDGNGEKGERKLILMGAPLASFAWAVRALSKSLPLLVLADAAYRFIDTMISIPLDVLTYHKGLKGGSDRAILFREISMNAGASLFNGTLAAWLFFGGGLSGAMLLTAGVALLPLSTLKLRHD